MASFKLALDAGHYRYTSGRRCLKEYDPNETREWVLNDRVCRWIEHYAAQYEGFYTQRVDDPTGESDIPLNDRAHVANMCAADLFYSAHHNAGIKGGGGGGITAYSKPDHEQSAEWRDGLYDAIIAATGLRGNRANPKTQADFTVLTAAEMPAVLIEHGFMDSASDIPIIIGDTFPEQVGRAVADYIAKTAGLSKKGGGEAKMTAAERVIARAKAEIGYIEKYSRKDLDDKTANAGQGNNTKYARDLDALEIYNGKKQGYDWCDVFADWCYIMEFGKELGLKVICQPEKSYGAGVNSSANYYKKQKRLDKEPRVGDQVYFLDSSDGKYYHTGIVSAVDDVNVTVIEGNAGKNSTRVVENVYKRTSRKLGAYGHPKWELVEDLPEAESQQKPEETKPEAEAKPEAPAAPTPAPEAEAAIIELGDKVTVNKDAKVYGKDYGFSAWVYGREMFVRGIYGDRVVVSTKASGDVTGSVAMEDIKLIGKAENPAKPEAEPSDRPMPQPFKPGDKVRLNNHAKVYGKDYEFSAWVYWRDMYIRFLEGDRAVVSTKPDSGVTGAVNVADLFRA